MHNWAEAFKAATYFSPIVFMIFMLIVTDPLTFVTIIVFLLGLALLITVTAVLVKLFWYTKDKMIKRNKDGI